MLVHTKTRRIRRAAKTKNTTKHAKPTSKEKSIPWRESLKEHLDKYSEAGVLLRSHRNEIRLTQREFGDKLGINQNHISEMENGKRPIGKAMAKRFSEFFKVDYRMFL